MWGVQFRSDDSNTPKYLKASTCSNMVFPRYKDVVWVLFLRGYFFYVLLAYTYICWDSGISSWYWPTPVFYWHPPEDFDSHVVRLLAYKVAYHLQTDSGHSHWTAVFQWCHWYIEGKAKGPSTDPCGTPDKTGLSWEASPPTTTRCCLSELCASH